MWFYSNTEGRGDLGVLNVTSHQSFRSNEGIDDLFKVMFPDSLLAQTLAYFCKAKTRYVVAFGLAPYFKKQLIAEVQCSGTFIVMFDESLNHTTKNKQLDIHVRFWKNVQLRFYGSQFLGHVTTQDLLRHFKASLLYCLIIKD